MTSFGITRQRLADEVAKALHQQIAAGKYRSGERLPSEPALMEAFGVGRSTVREAVRILAHSGILKVRQGVGTFVEQPTGITEPLGQRLKLSQAADINEVRRLLEAKIAEKAAHHRTARDIRRMQDLLDTRWKVASGGDRQASIEADIAFHISIAEAAGNEVLRDLYKTFAAQVERSFQELYTDTASFLRTHQLHADLLQRIVDRDAPGAWDLAKKITDRKE